VILELTPEQEAIRSDVATFARDRIGPHAADVDASNRFPIELVRELSARGLLGMTTSREHGGLGMDYVARAPRLQSLSR
jgi:alkylation response protein AidB-like acyl-CoA dehydrogenase